MSQVRWWEKGGLGPTDQSLDLPLIDIFGSWRSIFSGPAMEKTLITITTFCYPEFEIISITYTRDIIDLSFLSLQIMYVYSLVVIITVKKLHMKMGIKYLLYFKESLL